MQIKNLEEKNLIKELKSNSESAFKLLVENYKDQIFNTIIPIIQNVDDADDLTQEVFIQIYKSIKKFKEKSSLSTWIYKISISKAYEYIRYNKRIKRFSFCSNSTPGCLKSGISLMVLSSLNIFIKIENLFTLLLYLMYS